MNPRNIVKTTLIGISALTLISAAYAQVEKPTKQPNIVLIMADDLGYETIGCYGAKDYKTPNIDAFKNDVRHIVVDFLQYNNRMPP